MALHIQMSEEALQKLKRTALINRLVSFGVCAGLLLLFGGILYFTILIIAGEVPTEFITYTPPTEDGPPTNQPVSRELSSKSAATAPSVTPSVIVAQNATSAVVAPVSLDTTGDFSFDDLTVSMDVGGLGDGLGAGGEGLGSGTPGGSALEGTYYDMKLTRSGAPSNIPVVIKKDKDGKTITRNGKPFPKLDVSGPAQNKVGEQLHEFFVKNWSPNVFNKYYSPKQKLYASCFCVPFVNAEYAPYAYNCSDTCQDGGWVCIYQGRVRAPKTGKFRFIGTGDDFLGVRFNHKVVLEAGYRVPSLFKPENPGDTSWHVSGMTNPQSTGQKHWKAVREGKLKDFEGYELIQIPGLDAWNRELGGLTAGKTFEVKEGQVYPIQVVVSEIPGGAFGFVLLIEDVTNGKSPKGSTYDLFRTNFTAPTKLELYGLIERANFDYKRKQDEIAVAEGKMKPEAALKEEDYEWPPKNMNAPKWPNVFFRGRPMNGNKINPDSIQMPAYNEDSLIWTAEK